MSFKHGRNGHLAHMIRNNPNEAAAHALGMRGDEAVPANVRWGKRTTLTYIADPSGNPPDTTKAKAVLASTPTFPDNTPIAFALRFGYLPDFARANGLDPGTHPYTPDLTVAGVLGVRVTLIRSIDTRASDVVDVITLASDEIMPISEILARAMTIKVEILVDPASIVANGLVVEAIATPVSSTDSRSLNGQVGYAEYAPIQNAPFFLGALSAPFPILQKNPRRTQFVIQNTSPDTHVALGFGGAFDQLLPPATWVNAPDEAVAGIFRFFPYWYSVAELGGAVVPYAHVVLPAGLFATYESPLGGFTGTIWAMPYTPGTPAPSLVPTNNPVMLLVSEGLEVTG